MDQQPSSSPSRGFAANDIIREELRHRLMRPPRGMRAPHAAAAEHETPSAGRGEQPPWGRGLMGALDNARERAIFQARHGFETPQVDNEDDEDDDGTHHAEESYLANLDTQAHHEEYEASPDEDEDDVDETSEARESDDGEQNEEDAGDDEEEDAFDIPADGLKEISNLASFTVSSYKPGCGVKELRSDDMSQFWQSDGPQPHRLNIHFIKRVEIRALRLFLDYELDESYTPTKIQVTAGFGPNQTIPFSRLELTMPKGWIDVPITGAGGGADGNSLCCWFIRIVILENHQNGKDTHLRGVKVYALDDSADTAENNPVDDIGDAIDDYRDRITRMNIHDHDEVAVLKHDAEIKRRKAAGKKYAPGDGGLTVPDFMREPEIR